MNAVGVAVIVAGLLFAMARFCFVPAQTEGRYRRLRQDVGRGMLLGLEFLIAADVIRTVAGCPSSTRCSCSTPSC